MLRLISEAWLRCHGYAPTALGWWKLEEMGAVQDAAGAWAFGVEERQRVTERGGEQVAHIYRVAEQATAFFARRQAVNVRYQDAIESEMEKGTDLVTYAHQLFDEEAT